MSEGFFLLYRGWRDNPIFKGEFSRGDAWVWLIENACWKPTKARIKGDTIELQRGELTFSQRFLAEKWGWSKSRVDRFISDLRDESMIETRSKIGATTDHSAGQGQAIITICNYEKYQGCLELERGNDGGDGGATAGQQRGNSGAKKNKGTKETKEEEPNGPSSPPTPHRDLDWTELPEWLPAEQWNAWLTMRKKRSKWPTARAVELAIKDLGKFRSSGCDPGAILDQSTLNSWTGLFELKDDRNGNRNQAAGRTAAGHRGQPDRRDSFTRAIDDSLGLDQFGNPAGQAGRWDDGDAAGVGELPLAGSRALR